MFGRGAVREDPDVGALARSRGAWRGEIRIEATDRLELIVPGRRSGPDPRAIELARVAEDAFRRCRAQITEAIEMHRVESAVTPSSDTNAALTYVAVVRLDRRLVLEFGFVAPWDDDHTLGARVVDGELVELCGSVIRP